MSKNKSAIKNIKLMPGAELRRVRDEKGWMLGEAAAAAGIERSDVIRHLEAGNGGKIFFIFKLLEIYDKKLQIRLVD